MASPDLLPSIFSSNFEIHLFELGVSTGIIALWLAHRADALRIAITLVVVGAFTMYANYFRYSWTVHPWYYFVGVGVVLGSDYLYQQVTRFRRTETDVSIR